MNGIFNFYKISEESKPAVFVTTLLSALSAQALKVFHT